MDKFTHEQNLDLFIHRQNLARFQKLIDETKDAAHREQLSKLLAEEKSKDQPPPEVRAATDPELKSAPGLGY
jgi:hypothetical protein